MRTVLGNSDEYVLHEAISSATMGIPVLPLELDELKLAKRFENSLQITFVETEVNVTHV